MSTENISTTSTEKKPLNELDFGSDENSDSDECLSDRFRLNILQ